MTMIFLLGFGLAACLWRLHVSGIRTGQRLVLEAVRNEKAVVDDAGNVGWVVR